MLLSVLMLSDAVILIDLVLRALGLSLLRLLPMISINYSLMSASVCIVNVFHINHFAGNGFGAIGMDPSNTLIRPLVV